MKTLFRGLLAGLGFLAVAHPASAAPVVYTITGTVISGNDATNVFGGLQNLAGAAFTAIETFDSTKAQSRWSNAGGSGANGDEGFASVALTIGDVTRVFTGHAGNLSSSVGSQFDSNVHDDLDQIGFNIASAQIKADYAADNAIGGLLDLYGGQYTLNSASGTQIAQANFEINGLNVVSAVPLPASAPLFGAALLGLAAAGFRRRTAKAVTVACPARR